MSRFSASEAAFAGFRLIRRAPRAVAVWSVCTLVYSLASMVLLITIAGPAFAQMIGVQSPGAVADPAQTMTAAGRMTLGYLAMLPMGLIYYGVLGAAVYRAMAATTDSISGFLRFGADEMRLMATNLLLGLTMFGIMMGLGVLAAVLGFAAAMVAGAGGGALGGLGAALAVIFVLLFYLLIFVGLLAAYVRLSFAGPMTMEKKRVILTSSWAATRGRFWPLLGTYLLAGVVGILVSMIGAALGGAVAAGLGGGLVNIFSPNMASLEAYFTPGVVAYTAITSMVSGLTMAIYLAPAQAAYRAIHSRAADIATTFD